MSEEDGVGNDDNFLKEVLAEEEDFGLCPSCCGVLHLIGSAFLVMKGVCGWV